MAFYVVVRGDATAITNAATAQSGTAGAGIAPLDPIGPDTVDIVSFTTQQAAIDFSIKRPDWFGTVYPTLVEAEKNAVARTEGH